MRTVYPAFMDYGQCTNPCFVPSPTNGAFGTCTSTLAFGTSCRPLCTTAGYYPQLAGDYSCTSAGLFPETPCWNGPILSTILPTNQPATTDNLLTVQGLYFGSSDSTPTVYSAGVRSPTTAWTSATTLVVYTTRATHLNPPFLAQSAGRTGIGIFTFDAPIVSGTSADGSNVASTGADSVTITGIHFGVENRTHRSIVCRVRACACARARVMAGLARWVAASD